MSIVDGGKGECAGGSPVRLLTVRVGKMRGCDLCCSPIIVRPTLCVSRVELNQTSPRFQKIRATMADDMDVMAMMGITGFGKQTKKRELDPKRFEKNRREEVDSTRVAGCCASC